ncbi:MAG: nicotinamide riboside transporter PnuC [Alistipes sp.]
MQELEIIGTLIGLFYLYFEYKASIWLWATSIVMPAIYIFVYYDAGFYADMGINVYYLLASGYGWAMWVHKTRGNNQQTTERRISSMPAARWLPLGAISLLFFGVIAFILIQFTDSTVPYGDSFTTALSIVGLWMLAQKYVEQWLVWVAVDVVCAGLYFYKELYPTAILYALYTVVAVFGYFKWVRMMELEKGKDYA